jgi:hypothetical protein
MLLRTVNTSGPTGAPAANRSFVTALAILVLTAAPTTAQDCHRECTAEPACEIAVTDCLIAAGRGRDAVERLKPLIRERPDVPVLARLLARAYLADNNHFWAERTLQDALSRNPNDCMTRSWLAWSSISTGDFDLAREILAETGCPTTDAERTRWLLLRAFMAHAQNDTATATESVAMVPDVGQIFPEDEGLWLFLRGARQPAWIDPLSTRFELSTGYTSNARAGSPTDPGNSGPSSGLGRMDLFARAAWPPSPQPVRPILEGGLKGHGISASEARDLSYLELSMRPAVLVGMDFPRLLLGYKADLLLLNEEDKRDFYEGHRGEAEVETGATTIFAGGGYRRFAESGRTRWEVDGGLGRSLRFPFRITGLAAVSLRYYDARGDAYDLLGGTALAAGRMALPAGCYARVVTSLGLDDYPSSGGTRGLEAYGTTDKRFDVLTKVTAEIWSAAWHNLRAGLGYEYAWRASTADQPDNDYEYEEHRVLLKTRWSFDLNPWAPGVVSEESHVPLDYGLVSQGGASLENERIQDLLRQDEAARRGSSCVE